MPNDRPDLKVLDGPWARPGKETLPKLTILLTGPDNLHTLVSCWPTDEELRLMTTEGVIDLYIRPALLALMTSYRNR